MKKSIVYILFLLISISTDFTLAQQTPLYNSALINPAIENQALAGQNKYAQAFLHYRKQWLDIEGAPESAMLSVDWPLKDEKSGLALVVQSDKTNILGHTGIMSAYSHGIKISSDQSIRFGLAFKLNHNTIYFDKVQAESEFESTLFNYFESASGINTNFGIAYNYQGLKAGIGITNLVNSKLQYRNETENKRLYFQYIPQYLINLSYKYDINEDVFIRPEIALRDIQGMPSQFEASVFSTYQDKYSAGVIYRNKNSLGILASVLVYDRLLISYNYQSALGAFTGYNGGTHEITLGYRFYTSHFQEYKPFDNNKIEELIEFSKTQVDKNKELKKDNQKLKEEQRRLSEELKREKEEINKLIMIMQSQSANNRRARYEDETELEDLPEDYLHDPDVPIYIIVGVFTNSTMAKKFQQVLRREHRLGTEVLRRRNTGDYIVCVNRKFETKNEIKKELSRLKKITTNYSDSGVWIYVNK